MSARAANDPIGSLDDLELELRKLPGVRAAGFEERDDMLLVQLHVADRGERSEQPVPVSASRIAARHSDRPVAVEVVRWRTTPAVTAPAAIVAPTVAAPAEGSAEETEPQESRRARLLA